MRVRPIGSRVVITVSSRIAAATLARRIEDVLYEWETHEHVDDEVDTYCAYWTDDTGSLDRILGDSQDAWEAFTVLLPDSADTLENLANVAVRISVPVRPVGVPPAPRRSDPARGSGR